MAQARKKRLAYRAYLEPGSLVKVPRSTYFEEKQKEQDIDRGLEQTVTSISSIVDQHLDTNRDHDLLQHLDSSDAGDDSIRMPSCERESTARSCSSLGSNQEDNLGDTSNEENLSRPTSVIGDDVSFRGLSDDTSTSDADASDEEDLPNDNFGKIDGLHQEDYHDDGNENQSRPTSVIGDDISLRGLSDDTSTSDADADASDEEDLPNDGFGRIDGLDTPLLPSLQITKFETLLAILHFSMRHGLTGVGLLDLLKLINFILGEDVIPASNFRFNAVFKSETRLLIHFYCQYCTTYIGTDEEISSTYGEDKKCSVCNKDFSLKLMNNGHFFITIAVADQLKLKLTGDSTFYEQISSHRFTQRADDTISDIYDGLNYAALVKDGILSNPNNISLTFNTDGAPVFKSCKNSIWPIQFYINELPPNVRFSPNNVLVTGIWFGSREPKMDLYLKPFVQELVELGSVGFNWQNAAGDKINSKVYALCCCLDSVAKPMVQNVTQFNGYFGCSYCKHPGERIEANKIRFTFSEQEDRNDSQMRRHMQRAHTTQSTVCGVKGISPLYPLPHFDLVFGFVIDYMHAVLLGVTRQMVHLWCDSSSHDMPYYIGQQITTIDKRIVSISPPSNISRRPRALSDRAHFKANEWRSWLLFYSLPCLRYVLPSLYFNHFALLVSSIYLLLQDAMSFSDVDTANTMLVSFVVQYEVLYGQVNMTYNVHLMSHLGRIVSLWGPLWAYSAFSFESGNGFLLRLVKGTKGVATQIINKYCLYNSIPQFVRRYTVRDATLDFCGDIMGYPLTSVVTQLCCDGINITLFGTPIVGKLTERVKEAFLTAAIEIPDNKVVASSKKMIFNSVKYHSTAYTRSIKSNDCIVFLADGNWGVIEKIVQLNTSVYVLVSLIRFVNETVLIEPGNLSATECAPHLQVCNISNYLHVVPVSAMKSKGIYMNPTCTYSDQMYVAKMPNRWEKD